MAHHASTVFKSPDPQQPIAVLLLIENSKNMAAIWPDLRDQYLRRLLDSIVAANPGAPVAVTILETSACNHGSPRSSPRPYLDTHQGLYTVNFDHSPENRVSPGKIDACINYLDTAKYSGQLCTARHLIVAAATAPSDDSTGMLIPENYSPWFSLSSKLATKNVYFHIVVSPQQDMGPLTVLFEDTLRLQNNIEDVPPFAVDPLRMVCRLSARPNYQPFTESESSASFPPQRMPGPPRRNSYPADNFYAESFEDGVHAGDTESPSLVTQLQQVHGLTKKKVYGVKPPRQPFVRDERINVNVRDKYRSKVPPAPLTMPLTLSDQIPSPTAGGRTMSASRADRMNRLSQGGSPTDLHSAPARARQLGWPATAARRGSRLSTPEPGEGAPMSSSPASTSTTFTDMSPGSSYGGGPSDISSPVTPGTSVEELYGMAPGGVPMVGVYQTGGMPDPSWPQHPHQQHSQHPHGPVHASPGGFSHSHPHSHPHHPQYHGGYSTATTTYFPPMPQFYTETGHVVGTVETAPSQMSTMVGGGQSHGQGQQAGPQHAVSPPGGGGQNGAGVMQPGAYPGAGGPYPGVPVSGSPPPMVPSQAPLMAGMGGGASPGSVPVTASSVSASTSMPPPPDPTHAHGHIHRSSHSHSHSHAHLNAHAHAHPTVHANHGTPRPHAHGHGHKRATPEEDEERFTFGKDFVAATAALFEAEVLPAYPNFPGMRSGLYEAPLPDTLPASEAGELYASRKKVAEMQGQMPSQAQMNGAQIQMLQQQQIQQQRQQHLQSQQTAATAYELGHPHLPHPNAYSQNHQAAQAPPMMVMSMSAPMSIAQQHPQPYAPGYSSPPAHPASMNGMNARAASYASYPPQSSSYPPNYGSSLTGWAG